MNIWSRLLGEGPPRGQDKLLIEPPPLAAPGQVQRMLRSIPDLVDLEILPPIDIDLPDFTITLPRGDAIRLKEFLLAMEELRVKDSTSG